MPTAVQPPLRAKAVTTEEDPKPTPTVSFYSKSSGLCISYDKGKLIMQEGQAVRLGEELIEFSDQGDGWGVYRTDDAKKIAFLRKRCGHERDVYEAQEYVRMSMPTGKLINELDRRIEETNSLIQSLLASGKVSQEDLDAAAAK